MNAPEATELFSEALGHYRAGRYGEAEAACRAALAADTDHADSLHLLGLIAQQSGDFAAAFSLIRQAVAVYGAAATFHNSLGTVLRDLGQLDDAVSSFQRAIAIDPEFAGVYYNLGNALRDRGQIDDAISSYRKAVALKPDYARAQNNLGVLYLDRGDMANAIACFTEAESADPNFPEVQNNLGLVSQQQGKFTGAIARFERAVQLRPSYVDAIYNLGTALQEQGSLDQAIQCYERAIVLNPQHAKAAASAIFIQLYRPGVTLDQILSASLRWDQAYAAPFEQEWQTSDRPDNNRRPKIGLVSGDFRNHVIAWLTLPTIERLARAGFDLVCYANSPRTDSLTDRFKKSTTVWRPIYGQSDQAVADQVRADAIDILIDLSGQSSLNRLMVFAHKPAPLQVAWCGYPATTGLEAMDYIIGDWSQIPKGAEAFYREKAVRLPHSYIAFEPPGDAPPLTALPSLTAGAVTFGSFNALKKVTPPAIEAWSRILLQIPGSRFILKAQGLDDAGTRHLYEGAFAERGIDPNRITFVGGSAPYAHREWIARADIALDTFPYAGGYTTLETLWMGVPVITCPGETFASRHTLGYLSSIGLPELAAPSTDEYVGLAVALANDPIRLSEFRKGLRARMSASPLCDLELFAHHFIQAIETMWARHCAEKPPCAISIGKSTA